MNSTDQTLDWFERLTGFKEGAYDETRSKLELEGTELRSLVNGHSHGVGQLELVSLQTLRERVGAMAPTPKRIKVSVVAGDVRQMHHLPEHAGALFQVASQFNLLEMISPSVTPEMGVTRYQGDATQGPACAIAAGAATIYRNYFVPVGSGHGQTSTQQLDGLADLGAQLGKSIGVPVSALWSMQNGYALCTRDGLAAIALLLGTSSAAKVDHWRGLLRVGIHSDVELTDGPGLHRQLVSQAFCSALPVAYSQVPSQHWQAFATLVLEAAYEATLLAGVLNARRGASNIVLLTRLGGGAFGNSSDWIHAAMRRALDIVKGFDLDVRIVSFAAPSAEVVRMVKQWG